jgi:glycosyltransferase involved in cell wall biosynthesis
MRIGIFSDRYFPQIDGVTTSIESFRTELEQMGHEIYVFAPKPNWNYRERSKRVIRFPAVRGLFFEDYLLTLYFPPQAIRRIDKLNLDVVHFQTPGQIGLLGAYYATHHNKPLVTTYHTDLYQYVLDYPATFPGTVALSMLVPAITRGGMQQYREVLSSIRPERDLVKWHQKILVQSLRLLHKECDLVIAPSYKIQQQLLSWHTTSRVEVLPTGVDRLPSSAGEELYWKRKLGISNSDQIIIMVSRIGTEKNIGLLIRSFGLVAKRNSHAKLLLVGGGDDLERFQAQAGATDFADRIIFTGRIERQRLGALYAISTVLAFPSLKDTQGLAVNEASCAGLPVVMIDSGITEVVKDGENGFFAKDSVRDFADKLQTILDNPELRARMSKRSLELGAVVSPGREAAKLLRLYKETVERHHDTQASSQPEPSEF